MWHTPISKGMAQLLSMASDWERGKESIVSLGKKGRDGGGGGDMKLASR